MTNPVSPETSKIKSRGKKISWSKWRPKASGGKKKKQMSGYHAGKDAGKRCRGFLELNLSVWVGGHDPQRPGGLREWAAPSLMGESCLEPWERQRHTRLGARAHTLTLTITDTEAVSGGLG